jgi:hypothetical protein
VSNVIGINRGDVNTYIILVGKPKEEKLFGSWKL